MASTSFIQIKARPETARAFRQAGSSRTALAAYVAAKASLVKCEVVELPMSGTLNDLWDALGFPDLGGQPAGRENLVYAPGYRDITGIHHRLEAGLSSVRRRGTAEAELQVGPSQADGYRPFVWESDGGRWTRRHWRVTGRLHLVGGRLVADQVVVSVASSAAAEEGRAEWTAFVGGPLNAVLTERLNWVTAQFAARRLRREQVTLEGWREVDRWRLSSLHSSPSVEWETPHGVVVLWDDADGSAGLSGRLGADESVPERAVSDLIGLWWREHPVTADLEDSLPVSS